jgi:hypothetical protein
MLQQAVYVLCAATSLACAWLLMRGYRQSAVRLLFWSSLCFFGLAVENSLLFVDLATPVWFDLSLPRRLTGLASMSLLVYGLIWDSK